MLKLNAIVKNYEAGDATVKALAGVDIEFRRSEFVAVLGPSGCGKTTLLNIIGGLDRYTTGDLIIDDVSTKEYKDSDWDIYRNKAVGFVFQSYNLIPHQTVQSNVELALTLSGISPAERKKRAIESLTKVGLGDQLRKKPNQLSGGQMQRVAIARALVNDPEILLADEPTGALDTETSVQVMDILKQVAKDRLVIMVTHNPDLADKYATRVVRLVDGRITDDSNPYKAHTARPIPAQSKLKETRNRKKPLKMLTALTLSLNNLLTKKGRTILTGFAGSIGIIGIALILSLSSGMQNYIAGIERDTVSSYPITIQSSSMEMSTMLTTMAGIRENSSDHDMDKIYSKDIMSNMVQNMSQNISSNDLASFKTYLDTNADFQANTNEIQYRYDTPLTIYKSDTADGVIKLEPSQLMDQMMPSGAESMSSMSSMSSMMSDGSSAWKQLIDNETVLNAQFEILAGRMPKAWNEIIVIADNKNEINDFMLFSLGLKDPQELTQLMMSAANNETIDVEPSVYTYDELMNLSFKLVSPTDVFDKSGNGWVDRSSDDIHMKSVVDTAPVLKVVGVVRESSDGGMASMSGVVGYTSALTDYLLESVGKSEIARAQLNNEDTDVFTGKPFRAETTTLPATPTMPDLSKLTDAQREQLATLSPEQIQQMMNNAAAALPSIPAVSSATYDGNLRKLGISDADYPTSIRIYPKDFESKEKITEAILQYNKDMSASGQNEKVIQYTDITDLMMSSVDSVINGISTVLIAFVAISLIVSSIMIGIITYISVLERTKEIGVLRSIGASKGDISRVFNAETLIVGFLAGALGITVTVLLCIPANAIINSLTGIRDAAQLPINGGVALVLISMALTFIAGLIPSRVAAKKDPVVALRTE
ncbi:ABC transporter [Clostridia bacterium]|nr:ABC transporter [Clostridia bacterium]